MADNSEELDTIPDKERTIPEKEQTIPEKEQTATKNDEESPPQPKARGRPKGTKDSKPRIKRVSIQQEAEEPPPARVKAKRTEVRYEEEPPAEPEEPPEEPELEEEEEPPPPKSPRTMRREGIQRAAMERRQLARDRQDHVERILDNFMGF